MFAKTITLHAGRVTNTEKTDSFEGHNLDVVEKSFTKNFQEDGATVTTPAVGDIVAVWDSGLVKVVSFHIDGNGRL